MIRRVSTIAALVSLAAACSDTPPKPPPQPKPAAAAPAAAPAPAPAPATAEAVPDGGAEAAADGGADGGALALGEYVYTPVAKRDPFRSFFEDNTKVEDSTLTKANCGPICQWELDQLKLVAVVSGIASPLAMVEDPDGRGYMVRRGSYIGKRAGKVSDIRRDTLVVTELIRRRDGVLVPAKSEILLRDKRRPGDRTSEVTDLSTPDGNTQN